MDYNLELKKVILEIKKNGVKRILLQFPDGLKPKASEIAAQIERETGCTPIIWFGSCFGACDLPNLPQKLEKEIDLLVQFGHSELGRGQ